MFFQSGRKLRLDKHLNVILFFSALQKELFTFQKIAFVFLYYDALFHFFTFSQLKEQTILNIENKMQYPIFF